MSEKIISKEMIEERLKLYESELQQLLRQVEVYKGGIQDCQHWLKILNGSPTK